MGASRKPCLPNPGPRLGAPGEAGLTLIEIMVVLAIMALVTGAAMAGSMQLPSAQLRRSATMVASAIRVAFTRATATSRDLRLVMDLMLVQSKDSAGTGGADPVTQAERQAMLEGEGIMKGPSVPKPKFHPIDTFGFGDVEVGKGGKPLQPKITFRAVQTTHDDAPRTSGRAYLFFWRGGLTERASIQMRIGESVEDSRTLTLLVSPLTGKVTVKGGRVELEIPTDDAHSSDREDTGF